MAPLAAIVNNKAFKNRTAAVSEPRLALTMALASVKVFAKIKMNYFGFGVFFFLLYIFMRTKTARAKDTRGGKGSWGSVAPCQVWFH